jgi:DNA-binding transcriptional LysR family regulator
LLQVRGTLESRSGFEPATSTRHLAIAASDYVMAILMADALRRVRCEAPHMTFDLRPLGPRATEALDSADLDFLIAPASADFEAHGSEVLFEDSFTCVAWSGNGAVGTTLSPEEYLNLGHVVVNVGQDPVGNIDEVYLRRTKHRRRVEISTPSFFLAPQLVVGTDRIATIATRLALKYAQILPIKLVPLPIEIPPLVEVLHWHRAHDQDPAHLWFRRLLQGAVAALPSTDTQQPPVGVIAHPLGRDGRVLKRS